MKNKFLILCIILCSLVSGGIGAYFVLTYLHPVEKPEPKTQIVQTVTPVEKQETPSMKTLEDTIITQVESIAPSVVSIIIKKDLVIYRSDPFGFFRQPA